MTETEHPLGFAPEWDLPIPYIERTHAWYDALGTGNPYRYAQYADVPFAPLRRPLTQCRVALLTTAAPYQPGQGPQDAGAAYNASAKFYAVYSGDASVDHDLRVSHVAIDRDHITDDAQTWFPLPALRAAAARGRIGALAPRFHGVPTNRSQRHTLAVDCPELLDRVRADAADAAVLVANCPVCHQTMSLAARHLEAAGIATVVMGCAKDIVETCGVARFVFSDFPLGHAAGRPWDEASRHATLELALALLERAFAPRTTVQNPLRWPGDGRWKLDVLDPARLTADELARQRAELARTKADAQAVRDRTLKAGSPRR